MDFGGNYSERKCIETQDLIMDYCPRIAGKRPWAPAAERLVLRPRTPARRGFLRWPYILSIYAAETAARSHSRRMNLAPTPMRPIAP